jgi:hypothetical protein
VVGAVVVAVPLVKESDDGREPIEEKVWGEGGRGGGGGGGGGDINSSFVLLREEWEIGRRFEFVVVLIVYINTSRDNSDNDEGESEGGDERSN